MEGNGVRSILLTIGHARTRASAWPAWMRGCGFETAVVRRPKMQKAENRNAEQVDRMRCSGGATLRLIR